MKLVIVLDVEPCSGIDPALVDPHEVSDLLLRDGAMEAHGIRFVSAGWLDSTLEPEGGR